MENDDGEISSWFTGSVSVFVRQSPYGRPDHRSKITCHASVYHGTHCTNVTNIIIITILFKC
jgi:hypothetical protein